MTSYTQQNSFDLIVIGAGAAGMMASITAARNGKKVLLLWGNICKKTEIPARTLMEDFWQVIVKGRREAVVLRQLGA